MSYSITINGSLEYGENPEDGRELEEQIAAAARDFVANLPPAVSMAQATFGVIGWQNLVEPAAADEPADEAEAESVPA